jgi:hypothetical protein
MDNTFGLLKSIDARYIIIYGTSMTTASIYFNARDYGLVNENYVWMGFYTPSAGAFGNLVDVYGPTANTDLIGFIQILPDMIAQGNRTEFTKYEKMYNALSALNPERFVYNGFTSQDSISAYDCTKSLLYGIDRVSQRFNLRKILNLHVVY